MSVAFGFQCEKIDAPQKRLIIGRGGWDAGPQALKILDGARDWGTVRAWSEYTPGGIFVGRSVFDPGPLDQMNDRLNKTLGDFWEVQQHLRDHGVRACLELPFNEEHQEGEGFLRLAEASLPAAERLVREGWVPIVLITSEGNPKGTGADPFAEWRDPRLHAILRELRKLGAGWGPHEYSAPPLPAVDGWHFGRLAKVYEILPEDCRLWAAVGECGIDGGVETGHGPIRKEVGWRGYVDAEQYADEWLRPQRDFYAACPYVHAAFVFLSGTSGKWREFCVADEPAIAAVFRERVPGPARWPMTEVWRGPDEADQPAVAPRVDPVPEGGTGGAQEPRPGPDRGSGGGVDGVPVGVGAPLPAQDQVTREELIAYGQAAARMEGFPPAVFFRQIEQESGWRHRKKDGSLLGSPAGALGVAQIVPRFHPTVDIEDPKACLDYAARWMGELFRQYGDVIRPLVHYNGGGRAVAAWESGQPYDESVRYVAAILGDWTPPQFDTTGPSKALLVQGIAPEDVKVMCGPLAAAGAAFALGLDVTPLRALEVAKATRYGETPAYVTGDGTQGPAGFEAYCRALGMRPVLIGEMEAPDRLRKGRPLVISTPHHYYLAQRASRTDADLYVGNTGLARTGGDRWMSLERIARQDGEINGLWAIERAEAPVEAVDTPPVVSNPTFDVDAERDALWKVAERLDANGWPWFAQGIKAAVAASKGDR